VSISLRLQEMTIEEKLQIMEAIWDDLSRQADEIPSPEWHGELLAERAAAAARGDEEFHDWETAKQRIEKDIQ
jgi:hypothetical protein